MKYFKLFEQFLSEDEKELPELPKSGFKNVDDMVKKVGKKSDKSDKEESVKIDDKTEAILSKIEDAEDKVEYDFNYEFGLVPTVQYRKIVNGDEEVIGKLKDKINDLKSRIPELKGAVLDMKMEGDKNDIKYAQAQLAGAEAEVVIYDACLKQDVKALAKGLTVLAKAAKILDDLYDE